MTHDNKRLFRRIEACQNQGLLDRLAAAVELIESTADLREAPEKPEQVKDLDRRLLGALLRYFRTRQKKSRKQVAQATGFSLQYIYKIEVGERRPSDEAVEAICKVLEITPAQLLEQAQANPEQDYERLGLLLEQLQDTLESAAL